MNEDEAITIARTLKAAGESVMARPACFKPTEVFYFIVGQFAAAMEGGDLENSRKAFIEACGVETQVTVTK